MQNHTASAALLAATTLVAFAGTAHAGPVTATITADNHYALYTTSGSGVAYIGGNETGTAGSPGTYNWSKAETWNFNAGEYIYIAAWSDNSVAQGLLAQLVMESETILSGDARWEVMSTGIDLNTGASHPTSGDIESWVSLAESNNLWEAPHVGGANGIQPWGVIAGITTDANWMWRGIESGDPLSGGANHGEFLIFRIPGVVPAPGPIALAGLGGLFMARRKR